MEVKLTEHNLKNSGGPNFTARSPISTTICALAIFVFVFLAWLQAGKPLQLDNMDFPAVAAATADSGLPVYYRGEENPQAVGLYHPPLYIYSLAGWFKLFGDGPISARMFDVLCAIVAGSLALQIVRDVFGAEAARKIAPAFFIVYLLNQFALQAFAIADIDTSIYVPLILLAIWAPLRVVFAKAELRATPIGWRDYAVIVLMFLLCFWAKLTTTLSLPLVILPILSIRLGLWRAIAATLGVTIASATMFIFTYWIYGVVTSLDVVYTWDFLIQSLASKSGAGGPAASTFATLEAHLLDNVVSFLRWGLGLAAACAVAAEIELLFNVANTGGVERARWIAALTILTYAIFVVGAYSLIALPFGGAPFKYIAPVWPLIALGGAWILSQLSSSAVREDRALAPIGVLLGVVGFLMGLFYLRDAALLGKGNLLLRGVAILLAAAFGAALWATLRSPRRSAFLGLRNLALAAAVAAAAQGFGAAVYQARADYATQYDYGQIGFAQARDWLREHTAPDEVIMSMKDLGFAAGRRYLENYFYIYATPAELEPLGETVENLGIHVFVFTEQRGQDQLLLNRGLAEWIARNTKKTAQFGNYVIYTRY